MSDPELPPVLEAILFGAGRSMSLEELSEMLGEPKGVLHVGLSNLRKSIDQREGGAIQLSDPEATSCSSSHRLPPANGSVPAG